jgi:hypothetical protein
MRRCRIGRGKQLVEAVPGRRTFSGVRRRDPKGPEARACHASERRGDRVATVLDIRDSLEDQISAFIARPAGGGDWEVVKVELPQHLQHQKLTPTIDARPRPSHPDDPRTGHEQRAPGFPGGVG